MILRCAVLIALVALGSCSSGAAGAAEHHVPQRIVSLMPSLTEDLFAIGAGDRVVGVSAYSDYPPQAKRLPVVSSFASVNAERIVALHPDVVVAIVAQQNLARDVKRAGIPLAVYRDDTLDDVYADLRGLAALTGRSTQAATLIAALHARTKQLTALRPQRRTPPSVFVVLGTAPIFTVGRGSYIATLIALAGARNAADDIGAPYARYSAEALLARQPDVLVVDPDINLADVANRAPWNALRAVKEHRVYTLPDAAILERPGPRYNDGLAWLIATLANVRT